jgi:hypothetical protein
VLKENTMNDLLISLHYKFIERYGDFHQPTFELTLISSCAGNIFATIFIMCYLSKTKTRKNDLNNDQQIHLAVHNAEMGNILYDSEDKLRFNENVTLLKTPKAKRKSVYARVFIADYLPITNSNREGEYGYMKKSY